MAVTEVGPRLHPGLIASVIFVCAAAIAAAVLIIRKYCFPVNEPSYRYSLLRRMDEGRTSRAEEDGGALGVESDEELLRWILKRIAAEPVEDYIWTLSFCFEICTCQITFLSALSLHFDNCCVGLCIKLEYWLYDAVFDILTLPTVCNFVPVFMFSISRWQLCNLH